MSSTIVKACLSVIKGDTISAYRWLRSFILRLSTLSRGQPTVNRLVDARIREGAKTLELRAVLDARKHLTEAKEVNTKLRREIVEASRRPSKPSKPKPPDETVSPGKASMDRLRRR